MEETMSSWIKEAAHYIGRRNFDFAIGMISDDPQRAIA